MQGPTKRAVGTLIGAGIFALLAPLQASANPMSKAPIAFSPESIPLSESQKVLATPAPTSSLAPSSPEADTDIAHGMLEFSLAQKNTNAPYLDESITSFRTALAEMTANTPIEIRIHVQSDLASALSRRAQQTFSREDADESVSLVDAALAESSKDVNTAGWSVLQELRGDCLAVQGSMTENTETAQMSIRAYRSAQQFYEKSHTDIHWLGLEYKVTNVSFASGKADTDDDKLKSIENDLANVITIARENHYSDLAEYATNALAKIKSFRARRHSDIDLYKSVIIMLEDQKRRLSASKKTDPMNEVLFDLASNEISLFTLTRDTSLIESARIHYRDATNNDRPSGNPSVRARIAIFLSSHTIGNPENSSDADLLSNTLRMDESVLNGFTPKRDPEAYGLLKQQIGIIQYSLASLKNTGDLRRSALDTFLQSDVFIGNTAEDKTNKKFEAIILAELADLDHRSDYVVRSDLAFKAVISLCNTPESLLERIALQDAWAETLLSHGIVFGDIAEINKAIQLLDSMLPLPERVDQTFQATIHSDLASALALKALSNNDIELFHRAVSERRTSLALLTRVADTAQRERTKVLLAIDLLQAAAALDVQHRSSESIIALDEAVNLFEREMRYFTQSGDLHHWISLRTAHLDALNLLSKDQPKNLEAANEALKAGREYFALPNFQADSHKTALLEASFGYELDLVSSLTGNTKLRSEARVSFHKALDGLDLKRDHELIQYIRQRLRADYTYTNAERAVDQKTIDFMKNGEVPYHALDRR